MGYLSREASSFINLCIVNFLDCISSLLELLFNQSHHTILFLLSYIYYTQNR